jgi:hypothetical protein
MIRSFLLWIKHLCYATAVLAVLACLAEVGLRVYDSATAQVTRRELYDRGLVCKNWFVHHTLKPSRVFAVNNPDTGERVRVAVNSLGVRGAEPEIPKPRGTLRIVCLGDDATLAPFIPEADTFCSQLRQELATQLNRPVEVINAGVPDYCPLLSYLQLRHELLALEADLVILNFDPSDVADDYQVRRFAVLSREGAPLSCAHPALELPRLGKTSREPVLLAPQFARQKINQFLAEKTLSERCRSIESPKCRYLWLEDSPPDWSAYIEQALSPLRHLDDLGRSRNFHVLVAACPAPWQISAQASNGDGVREQAGIGRDACLQSRRPFDLVGQYCRANQIAFCDVTTAFARDNEPDRLYLTNAAAFSAEGHALYAHELAAFVLQQVSDGAEGRPSPNSGTPGPQAGLAPVRK